MEWADQELDADLFVWQTAAVEAAEPATQTRPVDMAVLRSTALNALDNPDETGPAQIAAPEFAGLHIEVASSLADADWFVDLAAADAVMAGTAGSGAEAPAIVDEAAHAEDAAYAASSLALLNATYPDGIEGLFAGGIAEGLFAFMAGKGPLSGGEEWSQDDYRLMDGLFMKLGEMDIDLGRLWEDFTSGLVDRLFPNGFSADGLDMALSQSGPISGEAEWTELDFHAFDLVKSLVWAEGFEGDWADGPMELLSQDYPGGTAEMIGCELTPPPVLMISFPTEDLVAM